MAGINTKKSSRPPLPNGDPIRNADDDQLVPAHGPWGGVVCNQLNRIVPGWLSLSSELVY